MKVTYQFWRHSNVLKNDHLHFILQILWNIIVEKPTNVVLNGLEIKSHVGYGAFKGARDLKVKFKLFFGIQMQSEQSGQKEKSSQF